MISSTYAMLIVWSVGGGEKISLLKNVFKILDNKCVFKVRVANFAASIFENVCVELCRAVKIDAVVCDFVLLLVVFNVVGWFDDGGEGLRCLRMGALLSVVVLILKSS